MHFFGFRDLTSSTAQEITPWEWVPTIESRQAVMAAAKPRRGAAMLRVGWLVYSPVRATVPTAYVETSNPAAGVRGMVLDYDVPLVLEHLEGVLSKLKDDLLPQRIEKTLSGNFRMVWDFGRDIAVPDGAFVGLLWRALAERIKPYELHPGLDKKSFEANQRWTSGVEWLDVGGPASLPEKVLNEALWEAGRAYRQDVKGAVPLEIFEAEIHKRWPGRWQGSFAVGATGVRFWDETADSPTGCMVKPDGMICFTGSKAYLSWAELFGAEWVREVSEDRLEDAIKDLHYDGRSYWFVGQDGHWMTRSREDVILDLAVKGFDNRITKGNTVSDCGRLLSLIQNTRRVVGAASLVCYPPGPVQTTNGLLLNITRVKALDPAPGAHTPEDFPFLWSLLNGFFDRPEDRPLDHFLAWLQRAYKGLLNRQRLVGQALFICGPVQNGKTLIALKVIGGLCGTVYQDPYDYLIGKTAFNNELFESYLWALNDADAPRENDRASVLSRIKGAVVNPSFTYQRKFGDRTQVDWTGRIVATFNNDPCSIAQLPEVNSSSADKLSFYASRPLPKGFFSKQPVEPTVAAELPKFAQWLLAWTPPEDVMEDDRSGVKSYFDKHILEVSRRQGYAYNFREVLAAWVRASWAADETEKVLLPADIMSLMNCCEPIQALAREWKLPIASRALSSLARDPTSGIVADPNSRHFRIAKTITI